MSKRSFVKYEGIGNDFILIDDPDESFPIDPPFIQKICHRKKGIGADGLLLFRKKNHIQSRFFNCDGSEAACCGNALRCLVHHLKELSFFDSEVQIELQNHLYLGKWIDGNPAVDLGAASQIALHLKTEVGLVHFAKCGVPHTVQFVEDLDGIDLSRLGSFLRRHPLFGSEGANVNVAKLRHDGSIAVRTYERGVEQETLACGTGAAAVAAIVRALYGWKQPIPIHFFGGTLIMDGNWMIGPVCAVFSGVF